MLLSVLTLALAPAPASGHGALDERIRDLAAAIAKDPADADLRFTLADVFAQHEEWAHALVQLDEADRLAPKRFETGLIRGRVLLAQGRAADAHAVLDQFLAAHSGHVPALVVRARVLGALGETAAQLDDYRVALRLTLVPDPDLPWEVSEALAAHGYTAEAIAVLATAIEKIGPVPSLLLHAMELEVSSGQIDAALARVSALQQTAPRPEPWMAKRAELLARAGRTAEARAAWQALIEHLAALPNLERGSHAMSRLAEQARAALAQLSVNHTEPSQTPST